MEESPQGVVGKKRETERFMSDMVIFISRGKKARFHAVGAFIPFSDDKGIERENGECGGREGGRERERERDTKACKNVKIMDPVFQGAVHTWKCKQWRLVLTSGPRRTCVPVVRILFFVNIFI